VRGTRLGCWASLRAALTPPCQPCHHRRHHPSHAAAGQGTRRSQSGRQLGAALRWTTTPAGTSERVNARMLSRKQRGERSVCVGNGCEAHTWWFPASRGTVAAHLAAPLRSASRTPAHRSGREPLQRGRDAAQHQN
jgi:hypothetical protein